jgi:hypothetical protein
VLKKVKPVGKSKNFEVLGTFQALHRRWKGFLAERKGAFRTGG